MSETRKRAKTGGEIGPNGESYKGGAFIATTDKPKGSPQKKEKPTGKEQIRPYVWALPPADGMRATLSGIGGIHPITKPGKELRFTGELNMVYMERQFPECLTQAIAYAKACIQAYNRGGVWKSDKVNDYSEIPEFYTEDGKNLIIQLG